MKEDQNGKKTTMEVKKNYVRVFSKDKGASYLRFAYLSNAALLFQVTGCIWSMCYVPDWSMFGEENEKIKEAVDYDQANRDSSSNHKSSD